MATNLRNSSPGSNRRMPSTWWKALPGKLWSVRSLSMVVAGLATIYCARLLWEQAKPPSYIPPDEAPISLSEAPLVGDPNMPLEERALLGTQSSLSQEPLRMFLMATQPGATSFEGTAQLGTDPRNPQTMIAGARLVNGALLAEIHRDHVVLERNGQRVVVMVDQQAGIDAGGPQTVKQARMLESTEAALRRQLGSVQAEPAPTARRPTPAGAIREINEVIRGQPVFRDSEVIGFKVLSGQHQDMFSSLGLQANDVVTSVNGRAIERGEQWSDLSAPLLAGQQVLVTVERSGELMSMSLDGAALVASHPAQVLPDAEDLPEAPP